ncbi:MAG: branched-chain amino acid aminotransferase [Chitinophagaceae bacterium]|jgi:branched-chain amino acid aminotransferase
MQKGAIKVTKAATSKWSSTDFNNLPFGRVFTDHMLIAEYKNGAWGDAEIVPYGPLHFDPSLATLHYGQSIFEGIKAFRMKDGGAAIFRPYENLKRFNKSAHRMAMPDVPEFHFIEGMKQLLALEDKWIPNAEDYSMYIRPFMFGTDEVIGVGPSSTYYFIIILSPVGPYFSKPLNIYVEEQYVRAAPGGVGYAKTAGNYAASLYPAKLAKDKGFDQILWMDAQEHRYVQECGAMNVFFVLDGKLVTPSLDAGTILDGITRKSIIEVARSLGKTVEERDILIDELVEGYKNGTLTEAFGAGTAVTVSKIEVLQYKDTRIGLDANKMTMADELKQAMAAIKTGTAVDSFGWMVGTKA